MNVNNINTANNSLPLETTRFAKRERAEVITVQQGPDIRFDKLGSLLNMFPTRVQKAIKQSRGDFDVVVSPDGTSYLVLNVQDSPVNKAQYLNIYA